MPFLIARVPVRNGKECSLRFSEAVLDAPRTGKLCPTLKRDGLLGAIERIVLIHCRGTDGHKKRGGSEKTRGEGRGGMLMV